MVKGFKGFNEDLTCRGFQYEIGKTYKHNGEVELCSSGFHFCRKLKDVHNFYNLKTSRICEIVADGKIIDDDKKSVCSRMRIVREVSREEIWSIINIGEKNTGLFNSGDLNSGSLNSGDRNSGNRNSGDRNSGSLNSGNYNSGDRNSGNRNSGDNNSGSLNSGDNNSGNRNSGTRNSGDYNSGNRNSGDLNSGDRNSGNRNSGDFNSGNLNSGDYNSGNRNSGNRNSGNRNSGDRNSGDYNSGNRNSGNDNSGDFNSGDNNSGNFCSCNYSSGVFMSKKITYEAFNKQLTKEEYDTLIESKGFTLLQRFRLYAFKTRTEKNGQKRLAYLSYKASWRMFWQTLTPMQKLTVKRMPHFDADVFYEITGIRLGKVIGLNYEK